MSNVNHGGTENTEKIKKLCALRASVVISFLNTQVSGHLNFKRCDMFAAHNPFYDSLRM